jgi:hypothetical protein
MAPAHQAEALNIALSRWDCRLGLIARSQDNSSTQKPLHGFSGQFIRGDGQ